jgi:hypothetical protein
MERIPSLMSKSAVPKARTPPETTFFASQTSKETKTAWPRENLDQVAAGVFL